MRGQRIATVFRSQISRNYSQFFNHLGVYIYKCYTCHKEFKSRQLLSRHATKIHKDRTLAYPIDEWIALYTNQKLNCIQISKIYNVNHYLINHCLHHTGIVLDLLRRHNNSGQTHYLSFKYSIQDRDTII